MGSKGNQTLSTFHSLEAHQIASDTETDGRELVWASDLSSIQPSGKHRSNMILEQMLLITGGDLSRQYVCVSYLIGSCALVCGGASSYVNCHVETGTLLTHYILLPPKV